MEAEASFILQADALQVSIGKYLQSLSVVGLNPTPRYCIYSSSFFPLESDCLACAVLPCFVVCRTLLVSFYLSFASLINTYYLSVSNGNIYRLLIYMVKRSV